jgi:hypothetical protein
MIKRIIIVVMRIIIFFTVIPYIGYVATNEHLNYICYLLIGILITLVVGSLLIIPIFVLILIIHSLYEYIMGK